MYKPATAEWSREMRDGKLISTIPLHVSILIGQLLCNQMFSSVLSMSLRFILIKLMSSPDLCGKGLTLVMLF